MYPHNMSEVALLSIPTKL